MPGNCRYIDLEEVTLLCAVQKEPAAEEKKAVAADPSAVLDHAMYDLFSFRGEIFQELWQEFSVIPTTYIHRTIQTMVTAICRQFRYCGPKLVEAVQQPGKLSRFDRAGVR